MVELTGGVDPASTTTYTWDVLGRLKGVALPSGPSYGYQYDYRTRRIGTQQATHESQAAKYTAIVFSGGLSLAEYESGTAITTPSSPAASTVRYLRGPDMGGGVGGLLSSRRVGVTKYNLSNGRGDVVAQSDETATLTWTASYEAYGKRTKETGENQDKQRANTKDEDPTGLLNEGFRYRDIETGVWLSRDPAGFVDGPNLYAYVKQNPWTSFDPLGLMKKSEYQQVYDKAKANYDEISRTTDGSKLSLSQKAFYAKLGAGYQGIMREAREGIEKIEATAKNVNQAIDAINWARKQLGHDGEIPFHVNSEEIDDASPDHKILFDIASNWSITKSKAAETLIGMAAGGVSKLGKVLMPKPISGRPIAPGEINWPANRGFWRPPTEGTIQPGSMIDRYGAPTGTFVSPAGTPFPARALPAETATKTLHTYEVLKPFKLDTGVASPWFGQPGKGIQMELRQTVQELIDSGHLREATN